MTKGMGAPEGAVAAAEQDHALLIRPRSRAHDDQVGDAVVVEVARGQGERCRRGVEAALRRERAVAPAQQERNVARSVVDDDDVGDAVPVEVGDRPSSRLIVRHDRRVEGFPARKTPTAKSRGAWKVPSPLFSSTLTTF